MRNKYFALVILTSCARGFQGPSNDGGENSVSTSSTTETIAETVAETSVVATTGSTSVTNSTSVTASTGMFCIPGTTELCNGPGACFGAQECLPDGSGYDSCICDSSTSSSTTSSGGGSFTCDPLNPTAICGSGKQCIPQSNSDPVCAPAGNGNFFDLCVDFSQCLPGLDCVNDGIDSCCMAWCRLGANDCPNGFTCYEVVGNPTINGIIYGICWDGLPCVL